MKIVSDAKYIVDIKRDNWDTNVIVKKKGRFFYKTVFVEEVEYLYATNVSNNLGFRLNENEPDYFRNLFQLAVKIYERRNKRHHREEKNCIYKENTVNI